MLEGAGRGTLGWGGTGEGRGGTGAARQNVDGGRGGRRFAQ